MTQYIPRGRSSRKANLSAEPALDSKPSAWWWLWRVIPHSHGTENMWFIEMYPLGQYEIWECKKCKFREAL